MFTIFSAPKAFQGHAGVIQRNAIESWSRLKSGCEIILFGQDDGTEAAAREFGALHVSHVACNEYGTPLISDMFYRAEALTRWGVLCYVNADIILMREFEGVARQAMAFGGEFLMIGRRHNIDIDYRLDFGRGWEGALRSIVRERGRLGASTALDFFLFRRDTLGDIPPFAVGRPGWDAWMVLNALERGIAVIDATANAMVVHQNHDYGHVKNGTGRAWEGPEADKNRALAREKYPWFQPRHYVVESARWVVCERRICRAFAPRYLAWHWHVYAERHGIMRWFKTTIGTTIRTIESIARRVASRAVEALSAITFLGTHRPSMLLGRLSRPRRLRRLIGLGYRVQHGRYRKPGHDGGPSAP